MFLEFIGYCLFEDKPGPDLKEFSAVERLRSPVIEKAAQQRHCRPVPYLPVIRMSDGALRYRPSEIEEFLNERAQATQLRRKRR